MTTRTLPTAEIDRLRELVDGSGLTRSDVAGRTGLSPGELTRLLSGTRSPTLQSVKRVLEAIDCGWCDLQADA